MPAFVVGVVAVGALGAVFTPGAWYGGLIKPPGNPPNWVFGPVWIALYISLGVAAWLVWRVDARRDTAPALAVFAVQLALNAAWSPLFFGLHSPLAALLDILLLWVAVAATVYLFWRVRRAAGALLLPYLAWVSFATYLNLMIWRLNA